MLSTYYLVKRPLRVAGRTPPRPRPPTPHVDQEPRRRDSGTRPAVLFLENGLADHHRLASARQGLDVRYGASSANANRRALERPRHLVTYLDAGAADALRAWKIARLLKARGASERSRASSSTRPTSTGPRTRSATAEGGFSADEPAAKHFVVNHRREWAGAARAGQTASSTATRCCATPRGRGARAPPPTWNTGLPQRRRVSRGSPTPACPAAAAGGGAPPTGVVFWPQLAIEAGCANADYRGAVEETSKPHEQQDLCDRRSG